MNHWGTCRQSLPEPSIVSFLVILNETFETGLYDIELTHRYLVLTTEMGGINKVEFVIVSTRKLTFQVDWCQQGREVLF